MVVERQLKREGKTRTELGREKFLERVWEWKERSGNTISQQMRRLGASVDWSRERSRWTPSLSRAVRRSVRAALRRGLDLPRQAARELGPGAAHGAVGPRGAEHRGTRQAVAPALSRSRAAASSRRRNHAARDDARRHGRRRASRRRALSPPDRQDRRAAAHRADRSRSSRTITSIRSSARAA